MKKWIEKSDSPITLDRTLQSSLAHIIIIVVIIYYNKILLETASFLYPRADTIIILAVASNHKKSWFLYPTQPKLSLECWLSSQRLGKFTKKWNIHTCMAFWTFSCVVHDMVPGLYSLTTSWAKKLGIPSFNTKQK